MSQADRKLDRIDPGPLPRYIDAMAAERRLGEGVAGELAGPLRIVLGGNANLEFMTPGLRTHLAAEGVGSKINSCAYDNWIGATYQDETADAWVVWISAMGATRGGTARQDVDVATISEAVQRLVDKAIKVVVILPEPLIVEDDPFSPFVQWRHQLVEELQNSLSGDAVVLTVDHLVRRVGIDSWVATRYWEQAKAPCHPDGMTAVGAEVATILSRLIQPRVRAVAVDLDDTLWGGLVGEVGPAGLDLDPDATGRPFLEFQRFLLDLSERGVAIAVVSKNDDWEARRPFTERPEMLLSLDMFVSFDASWSSKHEAIARFAELLNIGIDAVCFLDDSPTEREEARHMLPDLIVPELPKAPDKRVPYLVRSRLFQSPVVTDEDRLRVSFYKRSAEPAPQDLDEYLNGLAMTLTPQPVNVDNFDRVLSLLHKSNQFNLTLWRPTPVELRRFIEIEHNYAYAFRLTDRVGDAGIISVMLATAETDRWRILAWVMSCRVFNRGVEWAVADHASTWFRSVGASAIEAAYVPGPRNGLLTDVLPKLGLTTDSEPDGEQLFRGERLTAPDHHVRISA